MNRNGQRLSNLHGRMDGMAKGNIWPQRNRESKRRAKRTSKKKGIVDQIISLPRGPELQHNHPLLALEPWTQQVATMGRHLVRIDPLANQGTLPSRPEAEWRSFFQLCSNRLVRLDLEPSEELERVREANLLCARFEGVDGEVEGGVFPSVLVLVLERIVQYRGVGPNQEPLGV